MPRLSKANPAYRLHKGSGQAIVSIAGQRIYLGKYDSPESRAAYKQHIAAWKNSGQKPLLGKLPPFAVTELCVGYLEFANGYYVKNGKPTDEIGNIKAALRPLRKLYGLDQAREFGPKKLKAVRESMIKAGLARSTINQRISILKRAFRWAVGEELLSGSVLHDLQAVGGLRKGKTAAREPRKIRPVDDATVDATLTVMPKVPADMVRLQRLTGARPGEICILRPCDINREDSVWVYQPDSHKTEHHDMERVVMIGPEAQKILAPYLRRDPQAYCFSPEEVIEQQLEQRAAARKTPRSCGNRPGTNRKRKPRRKAGQQYTVDAYRRVINRACDKAFPHPVYGSVRASKVPFRDREDYRQWQVKHRWSPNRLRHSAATSIRRVFGIEAVQVTLGHSKLSTSEIYAERNQEFAREIAAKIG